MAFFIGGQLQKFGNDIHCFPFDSTPEDAAVPSPSQDEAYEGIPRSDHVIPGFHVYDGVPYDGIFTKEALDAAKNFQFRDDDVVLIGYPKSGVMKYAGSGSVTRWHHSTLYLHLLKHWGREKIDAISQTTFSNAFSWMKMFDFRLNFHLSLFPTVEITIS